MKRRALPTLHLEWAPGSVLAMDRADDRRARGTSIDELGRFVRGHKEALVGVSRSCVFLKAIRLPKATPEELRRLVNLRLGQLFPLPASELAFDAYQTDDHNLEGWLTVVGAMRASDLVKLRIELADAGLKATAIFPVALASAAVAARPDALVVDKLPTGMTLDVVQDGVVRFSRVASENANVGQEAQRTLMSAGAGNLEVVRGRALELLHLAPEFSFTLNEDRAKLEKKQLGAKTRLSILLLISSLMLAGFIWVEHSEAQSKVDIAKAKWESKLKTLRATRDAEQTKANRATSMKTTLDRAFLPAQPLSDMVLAASSALPEGSWLIGINTERGKPVQLRGTAKRGELVAKAVDSLSASPRFRDVKLVFANGAKVAEQPVVQFNIVATAVGNLPMPVSEKAGKKGARSSSSRAKVASASGTSASGGTP